MSTAEIMKKGWFKMPRTFDEWPWYGNSACVHMYLHLMMKACYKSQPWQDITLERGELVTSLDRLSKELNISVKQVRTTLDKLQKTNFICRQGTNKYTRIKVLDYDFYQSPEIFEGNQTANQGQTTDKQRATYKKEYKDKNIKNDISYSDRASKNFFKDYDSDISEYEISLIRKRLQNES